MATETFAPSGLDEDPTAYLALPRFNNTLHFQFEFPGTESHTANVTYTLTDAPPDGSWPVLVLFNGLGGHRFVATLIEGIARSHRVQILTLDKPDGGRSSLRPGVSIPLAARTRWMHAALLAVLAYHTITRFALFSHSNGLFYALYTLLHLPPALTATTWTLTGPFVPASISGSVALRVAAVLPAPLPGVLGSLLQVVPPIARAVSWSGGLLSLSAGLLSPTSSSASTDDKPPHQRGYIDRTIGPACRAAIMRRGMAQSRVAMGQEALFSLHGGDAAPRPGTASTGEAENEPDSIWGLGPGPSPAHILQNAFTRLAGLYPSSSSSLGLQIRVVYGAADGMVPVRGRVWLKGVLEAEGLIHSEDADAWIEVPDAGHDDVLFLEEVVGGILRRVAGE
ncbi:hypothetical protein B0H13DRAFT_2271727 [Mycena leptocephala]|nr:hypothetical protein B0H13DRAFT_2271727 [Mycena leptocephala]